MDAHDGRHAVGCASGGGRLIFAQSVEEIVAALAEGDAAIVSGGMSHAMRRERTGYPQAKRLIAVGRMPELREIVGRSERRLAREGRGAAAGDVRRYAYSQRLAGDR